MAYRSIPVEEELYELAKRMKKSMNLSSFSELLAFLMSKSSKKSMLGTAKWLKGVERDEPDRVF